MVVVKMYDFESELNGEERAKVIFIDSWKGKFRVLGRTPRTVIKAGRAIEVQGVARISTRVHRRPATSVC